MNNGRRAELRKAESYLDMALEIIRDAKYDEQDALGNLPENLQNSERSEKMDNAIDNMEDAIESIKEARVCISRASE